MLISLPAIFDSCPFCSLHLLALPSLVASAGIDDGWLELKLDLTSAATGGFELLDDLHAGIICDLAKDDVLAIEPRGDDGGDEKLGAVSVWTSVGHREQSRANVLSLEVLVCEFLAVDRLATGAIATSEVTTLQHELRDDAVELAALVAEALFSGAKSTEVLSSLWDYIVVKREVDATGLGRRDCSTGSLCICAGLVEGSVGVFDVEEGGYTHGSGC